MKKCSVSLREIQESDIPILYEWRNREDYRTLCSTRRNVVSLEEFQTELENDFTRDRHVQYMIIVQDKIVGTIFSYGLNMTDGFVFFTLFLIPEYRQKIYGTVATIKFVDWLFDEFDLFKVYVEVYSYNVQSLKPLKKFGFVEEGRFCGHRLQGGERHDLIRLAFFAEQHGRLKQFLSRLNR